jgi:hypothetical protein
MDSSTYVSETAYIAAVKILKNTDQGSELWSPLQAKTTNITLGSLTQKATGFAIGAIGSLSGIPQVAQIGQSFTNSSENYSPKSAYAVSALNAMKSTNNIGIQYPDFRARKFPQVGAGTAAALSTKRVDGLAAAQRTLFDKTNTNSRKDSLRSGPDRSGLYSATSISPYGASKLAAEYEVNEFLNQKDCLGTSLRFFNVVGSDTPELSDTSRDNLVPIVLDKIKNKQPPVIFGVDYPTFDGTCVRDYVDVRDIAKAHLVVANCDQELPRALNVGRGFGTSVREVITLMLRTLDCEGTAIVEDIPRAGDCAYLVADCGQIRNLLGVSCDITLEESIFSLL